ncbi:MAG: decarboxylase, partial [Chloroflexi bacterium]|nr:decarboxylase [Chloroflexota bacterium]
NIDTSQADALFLSGTNWRTVDLLRMMESDLGIPVFSANQVTMWAALGRLGIPARPGFGGLMDQS